MGVTAFPVFQVSHVYTKLNDTTKKIVISRGGTSSSKTYTKCQMLANWLLTGWIRGEQIETGVASVVRQFRATLESSVMRDFYNVIEKTPMEDESGNNHGHICDYLKENKVRKTFTFNGRMIEFMGADDYNKAKGARRAILWANEADEIKFKVWSQLNMRTEYLSLIDFNPDDEDIWINREIEIGRAQRKGDVDLVVSTYLDNPFLTPATIAEIEDMKRDPMLWEVFGKGGYGKIQGRVFDFGIIKKVPEEARLLGYGLDFGYTNDPTACVALYKWNNNIILDELFCKTGMHNSDIAKKLKEMGVERRDDVVCDSAEPKSIDELYNLGINAYGAKKGKDSIVYGISCMQQHEILITSRSSTTIKEIKKYKWSEDKNGNRGRNPVGGNDHTLDAARYICMTKLPKKSRRGGKILIGSI